MCAPRYHLGIQRLRIRITRVSRILNRIRREHMPTLPQLETIDYHTNDEIRTLINTYTQFIHRGNINEVISRLLITYFQIILRFRELQRQGLL